MMRQDPEPIGRIRCFGVVPRNRDIQTTAATIFAVSVVPIQSAMDGG